VAQVVDLVERYCAEQRRIGESWAYCADAQAESLVCWTSAPNGPRGPKGQVARTVAVIDRGGLRIMRMDAPAGDGIGFYAAPVGAGDSTTSSWLGIQTRRALELRDARFMTTPGAYVARKEG
jgi:hypothetical protein